MPESEDIKELRKELRKLKPQDRLKRLKEFEEKRKAEITDIEELIKDSEQELRTEEIVEGIAPEQIEINIGRLFEEGSTQLESTVREEAPETEEREGEGQRYLSLKQITEDYSALQEIEHASMYGPLTSEQMEAVDKIGERLDRRKYVSASQETANILVASRSALYKIKKYAGLQ